MILGRPWALALLLVPPILLWLRLRAARPRAAEASSLLVWSKVSPEGAPAARPRPPLAAWLEAAGAALLALGAADLAISGPGASSVKVLLDVSASMAAKSVPGLPIPVEETPDPERVLPGLLASGTPVVVVTDHRLPSFPDDPPRLQVVGVGSPRFNAGITAASGAPLPDGRWRLFLTIEAHGLPGPVEGTLSIGDLRESITLQPGSTLEVVRDVPAGSAGARAAFAGDALSADDAVSLREAGTGGVEFESAGECPPLDRALAASGAAPAEWKVNERLTLKSAQDHDRFLVLHFPTDVSDGQAVSGSEVSVADHPLNRDVRIDPSVDLGRRGTLRHPEGAVLMTDAQGPLAVLGPKEECVSFAFLPGGTWTERDPSFVVLARNLVEFVAGGPPEVRATGVLDPEETRQAAEGETFGDLRAALEAARRPDPATRHSLASILLLAGAGLLAAAWIASR